MLSNHTHQTPRSNYSHNHHKGFKRIRYSSTITRKDDITSSHRKRSHSRGQPRERNKFSRRPRKSHINYQFSVIRIAIHLIGHIVCPPFVFARRYNVCMELHPRTIPQAGIRHPRSRIQRRIWCLETLPRNHASRSSGFPPNERGCGLFVLSWRDPCVQR
jgi:hypothetical protein